MASEKLTDRSLFGSTLANGDLLHVVDISDTTQNAAGSSFKLQLSQLKIFLDSNIYNIDGTLTNNRTLLQGGFYLTFQGGSFGVGNVPDADTRFQTSGVSSTATDFSIKIKSSTSNLFFVRNDGQWSNVNTGLTDRWSHFSHSGSAAFGFVRDVQRTSAGNLTGYQINTYVVAGGNTSAMVLVPSDSAGGISRGLVSTGGNANQSFGADVSGGAAFITVGLQASAGVTGGGIYSAGVIGANNSSTGVINYGVWGNTTATANTVNYGGYFDCSGTNTGSNTGVYARGVNATNSYAIKSDGKINALNLPTSAAGLIAGDIWNNLGILTIV